MNYFFLILSLTFQKEYLNLPYSNYNSRLCLFKAFKWCPFHFMWFVFATSSLMDEAIVLGLPLLHQKSKVINIFKTKHRFCFVVHFPSLQILQKIRHFPDRYSTVGYILTYIQYNYFPFLFSFCFSLFVKYNWHNSC